MGVKLLLSEPVACGYE